MKFSTSSKLINIKRKVVIYSIFVILTLLIATPVLADYLGPSRTVTETTSTCHVILYECMYVPSKNDWRYRKSGTEWDCSLESKPWRSYPDSPSSQGCFSATNGDVYWSEVGILKEVTITHPPATISNTLQNCNLNNAWCNTTPELALKGTEPLAGYNILAIEGTLNGQTFACSGSTCSVPLNEGNNNLTFWAFSSWGDSSEMGTFTNNVDTIPPTLGLDISASNGKNGWYVSPTSLTATGSDSTSGLASVLLSVDKGAWEPSTTLNEGVYSIDVQAQDYAGNISNTSTIISVDTTTPSIDLSLNGARGKNGWHTSNIHVSASANDATSGVGMLEIAFDGSAYADYNAPIIFSDGKHTIQFKATDNAGNETETLTQEYFIDTIAPAVALPASWEVNETVVFSVQDDGSGLSDLRVVIEDEDEKYAKIVWIMEVSGSKFKEGITWDGKFKDGKTAPPGEYLVWIKTGDKAGNERFALGIVTVPSPFSPFQLIPLANPPTATPKPPNELFDEEVIPTQNNSSPTLSFGNTTSQPKATESKSFSVFPTAAGTAATTNSNIVWGAAATAVISTATAYALDKQRKRKEEEARQEAQVRAEVDAKNAALETSRQDKWKAQKVQNWLQGQAILNAQIEDAKKQGATKEQIATLKKQGAEQGLGAAIGSAVNLMRNLRNTAMQNIRMETKMSRIEAKEDIAWQKAEQAKAQRTQEIMADWRAGEKAQHVALPKEQSWWEKTVNWIDTHQVEISLGIGVVVGVAALILSGGAATPLVAAAWMAGAAAVAGGTIAIGTVGLNAYYGRSLGENVGRNITISGVTAILVTGAGFLFQGAMTTASVYCANNPEKCARVEPLLKSIDFAEQAFLQVKLGYQILVGDTVGAIETHTDLDLERMDGGMPGNVIAHQIGDLGEGAVHLVETHGKDAIPLLLKYGEDAVDIIGAYGDDGISLLILYGDDAVRLIRENGTFAVKVLKVVDLDSAQKLLLALDDDVLDYAIQQGPEAVAALSKWSRSELEKYGPELALRAKKDAIVLQDINKLIDMGPIDPRYLTREQQVLINSIAANSTQYGDEGQIVLGKWVDYGNGFTEYARDTGSAHYNPHPDMWNLLGALSDSREETAWLVNKQVIQMGIDNGLPFEYTLEGVSIDDIFKEQSAVQMIFSGASDAEIKSTLRVNKLAIRWLELKELQKAGYEFVFDETTASFVLSLP